MLPKISIVMPAYNVENYIGQALESLIGQTFSDWECCVLDDGSTDETLRIIKTYAAREPRITYHAMTENTGSAKVPRDAAIAMSRGEWVFSLDADDRLAPDTLEKLWSKQAETQADIVLLSLVLTDEKGNLTNKQIPSKNFNFSQVMSGLEAMKLTIGEWKISGNGLFLRKLYDGRSPVKNYMNIDEYDTRRMLVSAERVAFVDAHYFYRRNTNSITRAFSIKLFDTLHTNKLLCELIEQTCKDGHDDVVKTMQLQRFHDIIDKRILLFCKGRKLSREERRTVQKWIAKSADDMRLVYRPMLLRFYLASGYILRKLWNYFVTS